MDAKPKKQFKPKEGHAMPKTRREFLAQGLMAGGGYLMMPTALSYLLRGSEAAAATLNCPALGAPGFIPFIGIDCAGGAGLSGNLVVGSQTSGSLVPLASYGTLGIPYVPSSTPGSIDTRFGAGFHTGPAPADSTKVISKIFEGMLSKMSAAAQANTRIVTICHSSQDDSQNNELTPAIAVSQAGLRGALLQNGMGMENSLSGGNSASGLNDSSFRPMFVSNVKTVTNALSFGTTLSAYPAAYREKMAAAISNLSQSQANRFSQLSLGDQFQNLVNCGMITNKGFATAAPDIDPRTNAIMQSVYGIVAGQSNRDTQIAAIVYNALQGNSGPGVITIDGCDYHDSKLPTDPTMEGDPKDREIGVEIGRIVEAASRLNKPVFIAVYSDGAVVSETNQRVWTSDSGSRSISFMVLYKPTGAPTVIKPQIGNYTSGQTANNSLFYSNNQKFVSYIMVANYLNACGKISLFPTVAPTGFSTTTAVIDSILGLA